MSLIKRYPWLILVFAAVLAMVTASSIIFVRERAATAITTTGPKTQLAPSPDANDSVLAGLEAMVYKSPSCGCCQGYAEFLQQQGVTVEIVSSDAALAQAKVDYGVPSEARSCHTVVMDGYVIEGHVPLAALERLLTERPAVTGIALPGMPTGTPGMPGAQQAPFEVLEFGDEGLESFMTL